MAMRNCVRTLAIAALLCAPSTVGAQTSDRLAGHWEGEIVAPGMSVQVEIDIVKNSAGEFVGTFGQPAQHIAGLPLTAFAVDGRSVTFQVKGAAAGQRAFKGDISADGITMTGDFASAQLGTLPFEVVRKGDARIEPPARIASVRKELEGTWNAKLEVDGGLELVLTVVNQGDGTARGMVVNRSEGFEIPITAITETATTVTVEWKGVRSSYSATVSSDGSELSGTFTQGATSFPLTFRRAR